MAVMPSRIWKTETTVRRAPANVVTPYATAYDPSPRRPDDVLLMCPLPSRVMNLGEVPADERGRPRPARSVLLQPTVVTNRDVVSSLGSRTVESRRGHGDGVLWRRARCRSRPAPSSVTAGQVR